MLVKMIRCLVNVIVIFRGLIFIPNIKARASKIYYYVIYLFLGFLILMLVKIDMFVFS